ncbi:MAG: MBL fold metallo-hydrolase [Defluviitaleaceae bacterium]|nr:MBL fold metallo-hydrolase [Defluviitaleaceae bacterium]
MKVCLLTSGSIGNVVVVEDKTESILIDCGVTFKKFSELISQTDLKVEKIKNILITHEHSDHIKGVGVTTRKLNLQMWATEKTANMMYEKGILKETDKKVEYVEKYQTYEIAGFKITPFPLSHDAVDPVGYIIERNGKKIVWLTDTGYVSKEVRSAVQGAHLYIMEMNHNVDMLLSSSRPWLLKQRILSDFGHLSNEDGAYAFSQIMTNQTQHVFLAHISKEANLVEVAMKAMKDILKQENIDASKLRIYETYPLRPSRVVEL